MKNNDGFSLVELLVVIAIVAVMTAGAALGLGFLGQSNTAKCASRINSGFTKLKNENMAKASSTYMHLYCMNRNYYIVFNEKPHDAFTPDGSGEIIGNNRIKISMDSDPLDEGEYISFCIRKKDGSFTNTSQPTSTIVVKGQTSKEITIVTNTGKHFIK